MKIVKDAETGLAVTAPGETAMGDYEKGPFLHILPKLWLPYGKLDLKNGFSVWLESISIPEINFNDGKIKYRASRPYPNWNYVVFGDEKTKMGTYILLKEKLPNKITVHTQYVLDGNFVTKYADNYLEVSHTQHLTIHDVEVGVSCYSTEGCTPVFICNDEYERVFKEKYELRIKDFGHPTIDEYNYVDYQWNLITVEDLMPLANRYVFDSEFEDYIPFHAKEQMVNLSSFNMEHDKNAIVEAPPELLLKAIKMAPYDLPEDILPEEHPALMLLCEWWNSNSNVPLNLRRAKTCQIFVRANDNDEYHDIDLQVPAIKITDYDTPTCTAKIGQHFLITYLLGKKHCTEDSHGVTTYLVNGEAYEEVGLELDEVFPGYETLANLPYLPDRYKTIIKYYVNFQKDGNEERENDRF